MAQRPRIVIVGAGFAGLWAAKTLAGTDTDVTLVDRNNYHSFFPLLYQVATAELEPGGIAYPVRAILRKMPNVDYRLGTVVGIDRERRVVDCRDSVLPFDFLILAPGSTTRYFNVPGAADHAWPLRTLDEAIALRNHTLRMVEQPGEPQSPERRAARTFLIVGGGPTGVEYAGALSELLRGPLAREHRGLDDASVVLLEAGPRLLTSYPPRLSRYAADRLRHKGAEVRFESPVEAVRPGGVVLEGGATVASKTVVWTAGVGGPPDLAAWGLETGPDGGAGVTPTLEVDGCPGVFVVGDAARPRQVGGAPLVAQNAQQQGVLAARNILRAIDGRPPAAYRYRDLGDMAVIGRNAAVVNLFGRWAFKGFVAWVMWLVLHLLKLVGFRNRVSALLSWSGDYLFSDRVARLILPSDWG